MVATRRSDDPTPASTTRTGDVAYALRPLIEQVFAGRTPVRFEFWDGSLVGPDDAPGTVRFRSRDALRRIVWAPDQLGLGRAYVAGDVDIAGDIIEVLRALRIERRPRPREQVQVIAAATRGAAATGALGLPPAPPHSETRLRGRRHSARRDARAISHHYDVGNEFYELVLGPSMTYSCARWGDDVTTIGAAQEAKHDLVCRKLGLDARPDLDLLDVGCGWASLAIHAAKQYGARVVGVTISHEQFHGAIERVKEAGVDDRVEIRLQDYRDLDGEQFDAVSSIGMFEHVGQRRTAEYFQTLYHLLRPTGRLLNHAISKVGGAQLASRSFIGRYVFPDGELIDVADAIAAMESTGFEVRDVESLREHYARTLRAWISALERNWNAAVRAGGEERARVWRAYMAGSVIGFEAGDLGVHQVLGVRADAAGRSGVPWRRTW